MNVQAFNDLVNKGFDVSFNFDGLFYTVSTYDKDNKRIISLANEKKWFIEFYNIDDLDSYKINDKETIKNIIEKLDEKEIFY